MADANPRQATFLPGRVLPLFLEERRPFRNAFAAVAAKTVLDTEGPLAGISDPSLLFFPLRNNIHKPVASAAFSAAPPVGTLAAGALIFAEGAGVFLMRSHSALPAMPSSDTCTGVRWARSSSLAVPCQTSSLALRTLRWRK